MDAIITIKVRDIDTWDQYDNMGAPEMEEDLREHVEETLSGELGFDTIEVKVE